MRFYPLFFVEVSLKLWSNFVDIAMEVVIRLVTGGEEAFLDWSELQRSKVTVFPIICVN